MWCVFSLSLDFINLKGLGDVVNSADGERPDFVQGFVKCADEDDGDFLKLFVRFQALADFVAVHLGHVDVEQDHIRRIALGGLQRQDSAGNRPCFIPSFLEHIGQQLEVGRGIIHDQDVRLRRMSDR